MNNLGTNESTDMQPSMNYVLWTRAKSDMLARPFHLKGNKKSTKERKMRVRIYNCKGGIYSHKSVEFNGQIITLSSPLNSIFHHSSVHRRLQREREGCLQTPEKNGWPKEPTGGKRIPPKGLKTLGNRTPLLTVTCLL